MSDAPPISQFPLIWRWTSANHALFSESELRGLKACSPTEAARIHGDSRALDGPHGLYVASFSRVHTYCADCSVPDGCAWLRSLSSELSQPVIVSWDRATALQTTWEFFTAYWDDFCYPSSDDVTVVPDSWRWVLRYTHWEEFQFGYRDA